MVVLVTGVTGRIGANLALQLSKRDYRVRGMAVPNDPKTNSLTEKCDIDIVESDIRDAAAVYQAVSGTDVVVHLAAQMKQGTNTAQSMFEINTIGTLNILEGVLRCRKRTPKLIVASTDQTYTSFVARQTTFYEDDIQRPIDIYALTKYLSEQICFEYSREYGLPILVLRYSTVLAADECLDVLTPAWLSEFIEDRTSRKRIPWFGQENVEKAKQSAKDALRIPDAVCAVSDRLGNSWALPFTDVRDTVQGTILAIEKSEVAQGVFNVVGPCSTPFVTVAKLVADRTGRKYVEVEMPFLWAFSVSNAKAVGMLGYDPRFTFPKMVDSALSFRKGQDIGVVPA